ncbi:U32 family peptidase [uncultured Methanobrevibacter sp.]|uniref:U32 family peptidase n=1 Tax=uncultured Methanobrevibacter sp. TaxID=253161 RepID=UPI002623A4C9
MKLPELLAPVGSAEHLKIAILSGANSIYLSGEKYGARNYAENFSLAEIREAVKYAHLHNVKVYVTVNTLIKEGELGKISEYLLELYKIGVDAVLIQDIGLIRIINENIPMLKIHASTQMNIHNIEGVKWAHEHNIKRIVVPRELELKELEEIIEYAHSLDIEIEIFVHGALCYSYSGHCLLSSLQGGRSGNRGRCAQPCREKYELNINKNKAIQARTEGRYLLSPRDLSLYENLDEIISLNVDSIKIEGRMRDNNYVATVVNNYRKRLNKLRYDKLSREITRNIKKSSKKAKGKKGKSSDFKKIQEKEHIIELKDKQKSINRNSIEELELVFNREFTTGHLIPKNNQMIMNRKKPGHQGLFIGTIHRYNPQTEEIHILLKDNLIHIPEKGDGIVIESGYSQIKDESDNNFAGKKGKRDKKSKSKSKSKSNKRNKNKEEKSQDNIGEIQSYGFDISSKPVIRDSRDKHWRKREKDKDIKGKILVIKKVRENKRINFNLEKGYKVYLSKRNSLSRDLKELTKNNQKRFVKKSKLEIYFRIDKDNYPHIKGNLKLDNGKVITLSHKGNEPWQEAIKKPISNEIIEKQLIKIGDLPYNIEKITVNNNKSLFTPISKLNELRRDFFNKLEEEIIKTYLPNREDVEIAEKRIGELNKRLDKKIDFKSKDNGNADLSIFINDLEILKALGKSKNSKLFNRAYLEIPSKNGIMEVSERKINYNPNNSKELDISYCVNFLKNAIEISQNKDYELVWKLPDIEHKQSKESIVKILGILKKMDLSINIMSSLIGFDDSLKDKFGVKIYGNYPLNVFNMESVMELDNYTSLHISPELYKKNIEKLMMDYKKVSRENLAESPKDASVDNEGENEKIQLPELEILVQGNIELMISRKELISKKQLKLIRNFEKKEKKKLKNKKFYNDKSNEFHWKNKKAYNDKSNEFYLKNKKEQYYPIKTSLNEDQIIILNSEELCLYDEIDYLKSIGIKNFSIDARWKSLGYVEEIGKLYRDAIDSNEKNDHKNGKDEEISKKLNFNNSIEIFEKYCKKRNKSNFEKGLK